ncbi:MAG: hypothetical protein ABI415_09230 [Flavitalea sp.]
MSTPTGNDKNRQVPDPKADNDRIVYSNTDDIHDSERDQERLKPDTANIDLPDVEDIPGQERVRVLPMGELGDTTIASDDEEGKDIFGDE